MKASNSRYFKVSYLSLVVLSRLSAEAPSEENKLLSVAFGGVKFAKIFNSKYNIDSGVFTTHDEGIGQGFSNINESNK